MFFYFYYLRIIFNIEMNKTILLFSILFLSHCQVSAQVSGYTFFESVETYVPVNGTNSTAIGDDGSENGIPIGFSFSFGGTDYTTFSISTNGFISLDNAVGAQSVVNGFSNNLSQAPVIAPFWDDNNRNLGAIRYVTSGVSPERILEVGWNLVNIGNNGLTNTQTSASYKLRLHENGQIDFIYADLMGWLGGITASIGINDTNSFLSVTPSSGGATVSSEIANNAIVSTEFVAGVKYTFFPQPLGMDSFNDSVVTFYPNPVKNILNLEDTGNISAIAVFNILGQQVFSKSNMEIGQVDLSALPKGTYIAKVTSGQQVKTFKVIKE
jgi:hypothetical protein